MILYRPMDIVELRLVYETGMKHFPPRKPEQPIFYPVLNLEYANEIAKQWNAEGEFASGYIAKFTIDDKYCAQFETRRVGASRHVELWIPADELSRFNDHIAPPIVIINSYFCANFKGHVPTKFGLQGKDATSQFVSLAYSLGYSGMDFICEIAANHVAIFLNYSYWMQREFSDQGINKVEQERVLLAIQKIWTDVIPGIPLPMTA